MNDKPQYGKQYNLTGKGNSIANGNSWEESEVKPDELHRYYKGKVVAKPITKTFVADKSVEPNYGSQCPSKDRERLSPDCSTNPAGYCINCGAGRDHS